MEMKILNYLQNLHTHSTYCDGADSPEEMILEAISRGFDSIGFSGHSYMFYSPTGATSPEKTMMYRKNVAEMKEKYAGKIKIFCGLEVDMFSDVELSGYDYLIGSVHYFKFGDRYVGFDRKQDVVEAVIRDEFCGDGMAYAKEYYKTLSHLPEYGDFDIIGHFDLISKHSEKATLFDENSYEYKTAVSDALEALRGKIPYFEVNTGAIARGYRTTAYPSDYILGLMRELGFGAVISSDCHDKRFLDCGFADARERLKNSGFKEIYALGDNGFFPVAL